MIVTLNRGGFCPKDRRQAEGLYVNPKFADAIRGFALSEAKGARHYAAKLNEHGPYHRIPDKELQP
jgi:predicted N-acyltransferase